MRGQVQGVGFRPTVWRIATELGLAGDVRNTGDGVEIRLWGAGRDRFAERLRAEAPALARIDGMERAPIDDAPPPGFEIAASAEGRMRGSVTPDAATCADCLTEISDPSERRYRYPFANCTNCGPRFSIVQGAPYDRDKTSMRGFTLCPACLGEYDDPADRRFHAQPIACHNCGPRAWIEPLGGSTAARESPSMLDDVDVVGGLLMAGQILAIKGIGGFHLACDATQENVVDRLRARKRRRGKAFALMARDVDLIRKYCTVSAEEAALLRSPAAPAHSPATGAVRGPGQDRPGPRNRRCDWRCHGHASGRTRRSPPVPRGPPHLWCIAAGPKCCRWS